MGIIHSSRWIATALLNGYDLDYESNPSTYSIRVRALDEYNATVEGNFTVSLINDQSDDLVALTDENFGSAINLWFNNEAEANATYGHISDWNTSAITNLDGIFSI